MNKVKGNLPNNMKVRYALGIKNPGGTVETVLEFSAPRTDTNTREGEMELADILHNIAHMLETVEDV